MGAKQTSMKEQYSDFRSLFDARDLKGVMEKFAAGAVVHLFNAQDRKAVVFKGPKDIERFFALYMKIFPMFSYKVSDPEEDKDDLERDGEEKQDLDDEELEVASDAASEEAVTILSTFFDDEVHSAVVEYKYPQKGYRFIQETLVSNAKGEWVLLSFTLDSATDFSGFQMLVDEDAV